MRYLPRDAPLRCIHCTGEVVPNPGTPSLTIDGIAVMTLRAVLGAKVRGCVPPPGCPTCTVVTSVIAGLAPGLRADGDVPLLETAFGLTNGGTWAVQGSVESGLQVGGGGVPAPSAGPTTTQTSAANAAPTKATAKARKRLVVTLQLAELPPAPSGPFVAKMLPVHLTVVQNDRVFTTWPKGQPPAPLLVPTDGTPIRVETTLDAGQPAWAVATTHPLTNGVWALEHQAAPPFVLLPRTLAADVAKDAGNGQWKQTLREIVDAAKGDLTDWRVVARANGLDPDHPAGWVVVRIPQRITASAIVLKPMYPQLLKVQAATAELCGELKKLRELYPERTKTRLRVAIEIERWFHTFGHKLDGTLAVVTDPSSGLEYWDELGQNLKHPPTPKPLFAALLDQHEVYRDQTRDALRLARKLAELLTPIGPEFGQYEAASPRCLLWCSLPDTPRAGESPQAYLDAAERDEGAATLDHAVEAVADTVRLAAEIDQLGRPVEHPFPSDADRQWWGDWFAEFADAVFLRADAADRSDLPPERAALWIAALKWAAKMPTRLATKLSWFKSKSDLLTRTAKWFEEWQGIAFGAPGSRSLGLIDRVSRIEVMRYTQTKGVDRVVIEAEQRKHTRRLFDGIRTLHDLRKVQQLVADDELLKPARRLTALRWALVSIVAFKVLEAELKDPTALPGSDAIPSWLKDTQAYASLGTKAGQAGVQAWAAKVAQRSQLAQAPGVGVQLKSLATLDKWAGRLDKGVSGVGAAFDFWSAYASVQKGNNNLAAAYVVSGAVATAIVVWASAPLWIIIGATLATAAMVAYFDRTKVEQLCAEMIEQTEFGRFGVAQAGIHVPTFAANSEAAFAKWRADYFRSPKPEAKTRADLRLIAEFQTRLSCRGGVAEVRERPGLEPYPVALVRVTPRPDRGIVRATVDVTNILTNIYGPKPAASELATKRLELHVETIGVDASTGALLVRVALRHRPNEEPRPRATELLIKDRLDLMTDDARPFAARLAEKDGNPLLYVAIPFGSEVNLNLSAVAVAAGQQLLIALALPDADLKQMHELRKDYLPRLPRLPAAVSVTLPVDLPDGGERPIAAWPIAEPTVLMGNRLEE